MIVESPGMGSGRGVDRDRREWCIDWSPEHDVSARKVKTVLRRTPGCSDCLADARTVLGSTARTAKTRVLAGLHQAIVTPCSHVRVGTRKSFARAGHVAGKPAQLTTGFVPPRRSVRSGNGPCRGEARTAYHWVRSATPFGSFGERAMSRGSPHSLPLGSFRHAVRFVRGTGHARRCPHSLPLGSFPPRRSVRSGNGPWRREARTVYHWVRSATTRFGSVRGDRRPWSTAETGLPGSDGREGPSSSSREVAVTSWKSTARESGAGTPGLRGTQVPGHRSLPPRQSAGSCATPLWTTPGSQPAGNPLPNGSRTRKSAPAPPCSRPRSGRRGRRSAVADAQAQPGAAADGLVVKNGSKIRGRTSAGMPQPSSAISTTISSRRCASRPRSGPRRPLRPSFDRLDRVHQQVEEHLVDRAAGALDRGEPAA